MLSSDKKRKAICRMGREAGSGKYRVGKVVARYREVVVGVLVSGWYAVLWWMVDGWWVAIVGGLNNESLRHMLRGGVLL